MIRKNDRTDFEYCEISNIVFLDFSMIYKIGCFTHVRPLCFCHYNNRQHNEDFLNIFRTIMFLRTIRFRNAQSTRVWNSSEVCVECEYAIQIKNGNVPSSRLNFSLFQIVHTHMSSKFCSNIYYLTMTQNMENG